MEKNKLIRILSIIILVAFLFFVGFIINEFYGNPISSFIAKNKIEKYIEENYKDFDLEINSPVYNFKNESYSLKVESKENIDTYFYIYYRHGAVIGDTYESDVLSMSNTLSRLADEYSTYTEELLKNKLNYDDISIGVFYDKEFYTGLYKGEDLILDMDFTNELEIEAKISIYLLLDDMSINNISSQLKNIHSILLENKCIFSEYNISVEDSKGYLMNINFIRPEQIEDINLVNLLKEAKEERNANGISIFTKGEKKNEKNNSKN